MAAVRRAAVLRAAVCALALEVSFTLDDCLTKTNYAGQCSVWQHSGACWRDGRDARWSCIYLDAAPESMTDEACRQRGFDGVCEYKAFGKPIGDDDFELLGFGGSYDVLTDMTATNTTEKPTTETTTTSIETTTTTVTTTPSKQETTTTSIETTTTTVTTTPSKQDDCLAKQIKGKCNILDSPGACWSSTQETAWLCFKKPSQHSDQDCKDMEVGGKKLYDGACAYEDFAKFPNDTTLTDCSKVASFKDQCVSDGDKRWAACYSDTEDWKCLKKDEEKGQDYWRYNCKNQADKVYNGTCVFSVAPAPAPEDKKPGGLSTAGIVIAIAAVVLGGVLAYVYCRGPGGDPREFQDLRGGVEMGRT